MDEQNDLAAPSQYEYVRSVCYCSDAVEVIIFMAQ